jgi:hypothetical protein
MRIDLHVHSNNSDGAYPPEEVVRIARKAGLDVIALTDHDSTAGVELARRAGEAIGLEVIAGCEVSATYDKAPVHVLGYFLDTAHPTLVSELESLRDDRILRAQGMVERLRELGVPITWEQVRELAAGESVGRPHVAQAMVDAGVLTSTVDAFTDDWIGNRGRAYVEKKVLIPQQAVDLIRAARGVAVLAHPIWFHKGRSLPEELIGSLARGGLGGIEVDHPDHNEAARTRYRALAAELGLVPTGSSDWHGNEHGGMIGSNTTAPEALERLRALASAGAA